MKYFKDYENITNPALSHLIIGDLSAYISENTGIY